MAAGTRQSADSTELYPFRLATSRLWERENVFSRLLAAAIQVSRPRSRSFSSQEESAHSSAFRGGGCRAQWVHSDDGAVREHSTGPVQDRRAARGWRHGQGLQGDGYSAEPHGCRQDHGGKSFSGRFEREAQAISAFNHPNICTLYDVGPNYLVMELLRASLWRTKSRRVRWL